jgi:hypothetical protein
MPVPYFDLTFTEDEHGSSDDDDDNEESDDGEIEVLESYASSIHRIIERPPQSTRTSNGNGISCQVQVATGVLVLSPHKNDEHNKECPSSSLTGTGRAEQKAAALHPHCLLKLEHETSTSLSRKPSELQLIQTPEPEQSQVAEPAQIRSKTSQGLLVLHKEGTFEDAGTVLCCEVEQRTVPALTLTRAPNNHQFENSHVSNTIGYYADTTTSCSKEISHYLEVEAIIGATSPSCIGESASASNVDSTPHEQVQPSHHHQPPFVDVASTYPHTKKDGRPDSTDDNRQECYGATLCAFPSFFLRMDASGSKVEADVAPCTERAPKQSNDIPQDQTTTTR